VFRREDFQAGRPDAVQNIRGKPERRTTSSAATAQSNDSTSLTDSSHQLVIQNAKIDSLEARLQSLSAAYEDIVSHVQNLQYDYNEIVFEMGLPQSSRRDSSLAQTGGISQSRLSEARGVPFSTLNSALERVLERLNKIGGSPSPEH
jgi:DNA-directed RNA polymerase specialized sigma24 family protein